LTVKIIQLKKTEKVYSCNSYLLLGDWNRVEDLNTVIDPGTDDFILNEIERLSTGFGKVAVEQVILTHNHFDHIGGVMALKQRYGAKVLAFVDGPGVDELLWDGHFLKAADDFLEVIHTPGHSSDSVCLYAPAPRALFVGDTQVKVRASGDVYTSDYLEGLEKLAGKRIKTIYFGHDEPQTSHVQETLLKTLVNVRMSRLAPSDEIRGVAV
jgi:glyoxylase-like metal-dependent hydrolase (beta-lactamase superfamily II)